MKNQYKRVNTLVLAAALCILSGVRTFAQPAAGKTTVTFQWKLAVKDQPLALDSVTYRNSFGEAFTLAYCKFYISHITLLSPGGQQRVLPEAVHLVDAADTATLSFVADAMPGEIAGVSFQVGVDSVLNVSGAQDGDLDPLRGMFWTWNSGYVMAKLEGHSPVSKGPEHLFEYHIGGYAGPNCVLKTVQLRLAGAPVTVATGHAAVLQVRADINAWFDGPFSMKIADHPACTVPGVLATQYAANYATMFSLVGDRE